MTMDKMEYLGKMEMAYHGERNALEECIQERLKVTDLISKAISQIDTIQQHIFGLDETMWIYDELSRISKILEKGILKDGK